MTIHFPLDEEECKITGLGEASISAEGTFISVPSGLQSKGVCGTSDEKFFHA